jgi:hypothetical protein
MIELIINDDPKYSKIAIDGERYLVYYGKSKYPAEFNRAYCRGCEFEQYAKLLERKAKLAKLLSH